MFLSWNGPRMKSARQFNSARDNWAAQTADFTSSPEIPRKRLRPASLREITGESLRFYEPATRRRLRPARMRETSFSWRVRFFTSGECLFYSVARAVQHLATRQMGESVSHNALTFLFCLAGRRCFAPSWSGSIPFRKTKSYRDRLKGFPPSSFYGFSPIKRALYCIMTGVVRACTPPYFSAKIRYIRDLSLIGYANVRN